MENYGPVMCAAVVFFIIGAVIMFKITQALFDDATGRQ
jgi:hypothetical protein